VVGNLFDKSQYIEFIEIGILSPQIPIELKLGQERRQWEEEKKSK
jgi:hypothetical protein